MEKLETLKLDNICEGSLPELFQRELEAVTSNISDLNSDPDKKRKITIELSFIPFSDRTGADIELKVVTKLAGTESVSSRMFIHRSGGKNYALPRDARQQEIFGSKKEQEEASKGGVQ